MVRIPHSPIPRAGCHVRHPGLATIHFTLSYIGPDPFSGTSEVESEPVPDVSRQDCPTFRPLGGGPERDLPLTSRTPLDLFQLPFAFSQTSLLTADQFKRELARRGLWPLDIKHLEELHRTRLLVPMFRLVRDVRGAQAAARREERSPLEYLSYTATSGRQLRELAEAGRLKEVTSERFRSWLSYRRSLEDFTLSSSEFLYRPYQLLVSARKPPRPDTANAHT